VGQEADCTLRIGRRALTGKALLETDHILFRGPERLKIALKDLRSVSASGGLLQLDLEGGPASLELGKAAEKWAHKILHPPTLLDKLGVKAGVKVALVGDFDAAFVRELGETVAKAKDADLILFAARGRKALARVAALAGSMKRDAGLWIVYPKGVDDIREVEVIEAGRAAGLKDIKVASFSATHTALKFVVPLSKRAG
jgi:hypothetical protein